MNKKILTYTISDQQEGKTVEQFLRSKGYSHRLVVHLRNTPMGLAIEGQPVFTIHRLKSGEKLTVTLTEEENSLNIVPVPLPLSIVYEDEDILVVNKDSGVPIHPSQGHFDNTLANAVAWYFREKGEPMIYRAINRLDRDTTGLLILAKHMLSACILSDQMLKRQICREYRAIVCGLTPESGTITSPIGRAEGSTVERRVDPEHGEYACTHYRRISYNAEKNLSYILLKLDTGRTHQIRVHMASIGHPLPGDFLYHPDYRYISRQPLHSYQLNFTHPLTGQSVEYRADLPEDMARLL
ncbi:MAG: RluA family pseudouridine synthase [Enterocloster sp.]